MNRNRFLTAILGAVSIVAIGLPACAQNVVVKDGNGNAQTLCAATQANGSLSYCFVYHNGAGVQEDIATKALQSLQNASLQVIANTVSNTGSPATTAQTVQAASLPLPTGAASESNLTSVKTALGSPFQAGGSIANTNFGAKLLDNSGAAFGTSSNPVYVTGGTSSGGGSATPTGTAGSPVAAVVSVQGIAGGTSVPVNGTVNIGTAPTITVVNAAGSAAIGTVGVTALPALPAGTNNIGTVNTKTDGVSDGALTTGWTAATPITTTGYGALLISVPALSGTITVNGSLTGTTLHPLAVVNLADNSTAASITAPGLYQVTAAGSVSYALSSGGTATVNVVLKR